jgi:hypothetical protein
MKGLHQREALLVFIKYSMSSFTSSSCNILDHNILLYSRTLGSGSSSEFRLNVVLPLSFT